MATENRKQKIEVSARPVKFRAAESPKAAFNRVNPCASVVNWINKLVRANHLKRWDAKLLA